MENLEKSGVLPGSKGAYPFYIYIYIYKKRERGGEGERGREVSTNLQLTIKAQRS